MQPDERRLTARVVLVQYLSQDSVARLDSFRQITKHMGVFGSEYDSPPLCLCWFLGTIGCSSPLPLRCADLRILLIKCQVIMPPPTVLPSRHLPASLLSNHFTFGFLFLCPSSYLSGRCIGIPEEVCRLDPSCFPTRCLRGKLLFYSIMLLHPHHLHYPHPPFIIFQFLICQSLRKLRRNRSVKAQRMMQRSCHRLLLPQ